MSSSKISKIMPFLSKAAPFALAFKALEKVSPQMKNFITGAGAAGYGSEQILDFLRNNINPEGEDASGGGRADEQANRARQQFEEQPKRLAQTGATLGAALGGGALGAALGGAGEVAQAAAAPQAQGQAEEKKVPLAERVAEDVRLQQGGTPQQTQAPIPATAAQNFISQHPDVGGALDQLISQGLDPGSAAAQLKQDRKFANTIASIEQRVGQDFVSLINQIFEGKGLPPQQAGGAQGGRPTEQEILAEAAKLFQM